MLGQLIGILLALVIIGVIIWGVQQVVAVIPIPDVFKTIINVVVIVIIVVVAIWVVVQLLGVAGVSVPLLR